MLRAYGDGNLFGESYGEGPIRVIWLHGWARRGQDFAAAAGEIAAAGLASVAFDLPGFGASPAPREAGGAREYADLITPALRDLAESPLVLVGHSFGGRVATVVAARHPELVRALVLTGAPLVRATTAASPPPRGYRLARALHRRGWLSEARMEAARQRYGSADYRNASGVIRDVLVASVNESYEAELAHVAAPVTLLWGAQDHEVPLRVAERAAELLGGEARLVVLDGVGHLVPTQAPHDLAVVVEMVA